MALNSITNPYPQLTDEESKEFIDLESRGGGTTDDDKQRYEELREKVFGDDEEKRIEDDIQHENEDPEDRLDDEE